MKKLKNPYQLNKNLKIKNFNKKKLKNLDKSNKNLRTKN